MPLTIGDLKKRIEASRAPQQTSQTLDTADHIDANPVEVAESKHTSVTRMVPVLLDDDSPSVPDATEEDLTESEHVTQTVHHDGQTALDARGPNDFDLVHISLELIRIDPHQPRHYLPPDLRSRLAQSELTNQQVLSELIERVRQNDPEAIACFEDIKSLAESIADVSLRQPIEVTRIREKSGQVVYRLINGERRFWACLLLQATLPRHRAEDFESVAMLIEREDATSDDVLRAQWASNLERKAISTVDFAQFVYDVRDTYLRRMQVDERPLRQQLGAEWGAAPASDVVAELSAREVARVTKRKLSHRHIYRYCTVAEHLDERAKAAGRINNIGLRQLLRISKLPPEAQLEAISQSPSDALDLEVTVEPVTRPRSHEMDLQGVARGRPPTLDSQITLLTKLTMDVSKQRDRALRRAEPAKLQYLRQSVDEAIHSLTAYQRQIDAYITGGNVKGQRE